MPTNGFSIKPLKVKLLAGEQKATEERGLDRALNHFFDCRRGRSSRTGGGARTATRPGLMETPSRVGLAQESLGVLRFVEFPSLIRRVFS